MKIKFGRKKKQNAPEMRAETLSDKSKFAIVESYKSARTNIMFSLSADDNKVFAVTSYSKGEGKSTVSANLAISFSKMEKRVLLVDSDLRRPNLHNIFKVENTAGLSNIIGKMVDFDDVVHRGVLPNLDILPSGTIPPNPSELLCSNRFINLFNRLSNEYDYVIFDRVVKDALPKFVSGLHKITIEQWRSTCNYTAYKECIDELLDANGIDIPFRRRKLDHYLWHTYRKPSEEEAEE